MDLVNKLRSRVDTKYIVYIMILIYTILFSYFTILKHYTFQTSAYDLGIFLNSFWNTIHEGKILYTTLWEGSRFQNHFSPILFLIIPIYEVLSRVETLLILQSFMLGLGALPIYWIARNEINKKAGVIFAFLYLIYPALHGINRYDFHEVALAPTFILFSFYYFKEKNYSISAIFIMLSLISREDVAMVIVPMAILWLWERKDKWSIKDSETVFCISIIFIGLIWFLIATQIIIPIFNPQGYWFVKDYRAENIFLSMNKKAIFLINIFLPLLFIPLFNKWILISFPIFARNLLSTRPTRFEINNQHSALILPFVFLSSIYFIKQVSEHIEEPIRSFLKRLVYSGVMICTVISFLISPIPNDIVKNSIFSKTTTIPNNGPVPITGIMPITPHDKTLNQIIEMIPRNASVYAQSNIFSHMADRSRVYYVTGDLQLFKGWNNPQIDLIVPWQEAIDFEYILVDDTDKRSVIRRTDAETLDIISKNYGIYAAADKIYLFKKGYNGTNVLLPSLLNNFGDRFILGYNNGIIINYYNNYNLSGYPVLTDRAPNVKLKLKSSVSPVRGIVNNVNFSIKYDGYIYTPMNGSYVFLLISDDGSRLFLDDQLVIDTWLTRPPIEEYYKTYISEGLHKIRVDYRQNVNAAYINLYWYAPWAGSFTIIPEEYFYIPKTNIDNIYNGGTINYYTDANNTDDTVNTTDGNTTDINNT